MNSEPPTPPRPSWRPVRVVLRFVAGSALAVFLMWLLFAGTDWTALGRAMAGIGWGWFLLAQVYGWATFFTRAKRWHVIARVTQPVAYGPVFRAAQVGQLVNLAPVPRLGEFVRALMLARIAPVSFSKSLSTAAFDRVMDLLALLILLLMSAAVFPVDRDITIPAALLHRDAPLVVSTGLLRPAVYLLGALVAGALVVFLLLYVRRAWVTRLITFVLRPVSEDLAQTLCAVFDEFADGLHVFRSGGGLFQTLFWSLATWGLSLLTVDAVLRAFVAAPPWYASVVLLTMVAIFLLVNVTPGLIGQFHLGTIAGMLFAVPHASLIDIKAVAIVSHVCAIYPTVILGVYCLLSPGRGLRRFGWRARPGDGAP